MKIDTKIYQIEEIIFFPRVYYWEYLLGHEDSESFNKEDPIKKDKQNYQDGILRWLGINFEFFKFFMQ